MKVLVTSGGTKVQLDPVRFLTNMSTGRFGSEIATELLNMKHEIIFLTAKGLTTPFTFNVNLLSDLNPKDKLGALSEKIEWAEKASKQYTEIVYNSFDEYAAKLEATIRSDN